MPTRSRFLRLALIAIIAAGVATPGLAPADEASPAPAATSAKAATPDASPSNEGTDAKPKTRQFSWGAKTFDAALLRPLEFCGLVASSAAFIPAALMTLPSGRDSVETGFDAMVREPSESVFDRRLGDF